MFWPGWSHLPIDIRRSVLGSKGQNGYVDFSWVASRVAPPCSTCCRVRFSRFCHLWNVLSKTGLLERCHLHIHSSFFYLSVSDPKPHDIHIDEYGLLTSFIVDNGHISGQRG